MLLNIFVCAAGGLELSRFGSKSLLLYTYVRFLFRALMRWSRGAVEEVMESEVGDGVMEVVRGTKPLEWWDEGNGGRVTRTWMTQPNEDNHFQDKDEDDGNKKTTRRRRQEDKKKTRR